MSEPCPKCGVRADIGCKHQPAEGSAPPAIRDPRMKRHGNTKPAVGQGFAAFHKPSPRDFRAILGKAFKR